jgi:CheY-like chemotaxis protein
MTLDKWVYIVDDSTDYQFLLQQVFSKFLPQYQVRFFSSGEALHEHMLASTDRPGVLFIDVNMPASMSGLDTLQLVRQQAGWHYLPVVMMTNMVSARDIELCMEAGASSFLRKPSDLDSMKEFMRSVCFYWLELNIQAIYENS